MSVVVSTEQIAPGKHYVYPDGVKWGIIDRELYIYDKNDVVLGTHRIWDAVRQVSSPQATEA